jgi:hypothetical protein
MDPFSLDGNKFVNHVQFPEKTCTIAAVFFAGGGDDFTVQFSVLR